MKTFKQCLEIAADSVQKALEFPECAQLAQEHELTLDFASYGLTPIFIGIFACVACGFLAIAMSSVLRSYVVPEPSDPRYSEICGFQSLSSNGKDILCHKKKICRIWRIQGIDHDAVSKQERNHLHQLRAHVITSLAELKPTPSIKFFTTRTKMLTLDAPNPNIANREFPALEMIRQKWSQSFIDNPLYENNHYIMIDVPNTAAGRKTLETADITITSSFPHYKPKLLTHMPDPEAGGENVLTPLTRVLSPTNKISPIGQPNEEIADLICSDRIDYQGKGTFKFSSASGDKYVAVMGIRKLPDLISEQPMLALSRIRAECTVLHSLRPIDTDTALAGLGIKQKRVQNPNADVAIVTQINEVIQMLQGTHTSGTSSKLHDYAMTVMVHADSKDKIRASVEEVWRALSPTGITPVTEGHAGQAAFWQFQPGYNFYPRAYRFLSEQCAILTIPQSIPAGLTSSCWTKKPLTMFRTTTNSAYAFQFHPVPDREAAGHTVIIAPTGRGKTTLMSMLAAHVLDIPDASVQIFDRNLGAESFVRCAGGSYVSFQGTPDGMIKAALNPLQMDDTPSNRIFLKRWLLGLIPDNTPQDQEDVYHAIETAYDLLPKESRSLKKLYYTGFRKDSQGKKYLKPWVEQEEYADLFNADEDSTQALINDANVRLVGYDCTTAFDDPLLAAPLIEYLTHQMREARPGMPSLAFIDETEPLLKNANFRDAIKVGLQEGRKLRHIYVLCFQRPEAIHSTGMSQLIRGQCPTIIFAPNPQATPDDYRDFDLTDGEMDFILERKVTDSRRAMLVKRYQGVGSAIIDFDLAPLGGLLRTFASGKAQVRELRNLINQNGESAGVMKYLDIHLG